MRAYDMSRLVGDCGAVASTCKVLMEIIFCTMLLFMFQITVSSARFMHRLCFAKNNIHNGTLADNLTDYVGVLIAQALLAKWC